MKKILSNREKRESVIVRLEGGLGSQLFGMMTLLYCKRNGISHKVDLSYFAENIKQPVTTFNGLTKWNWKLDSYGWHLDHIKSNTPVLNQYTYNFYRKRDNLDISQKVLSSDWRNDFPLSQNVFELLDAHGISDAKNFCVLHIRRGDYLKVSSKIVEDLEINKLLKNIKKVLPKQIVIVSDSRVPEKSKDLFQESLENKTLICLDNATYLDTEIHDLMRVAPFLITSNSSFSFTAAMLNETDNFIAFSPTNFFSDNFRSVNAIYQSRSSWMILN